MLSEIAELRGREATLERSEARFRALTEAVTAAVWMCDADGEIVEICPSWAAFTGQSFAEYAGRGWQAVVHPDDQARAAAAWSEAVARREAYQVVYRLRRHDGVYRLTRARGAPRRGEDGAVREWIGANFDITEQERVSLDLRDREERLRAALTGSGAGTFRWNIQTNALDWDEELDALFGLLAGETTRSLEAFIARVHPDDRPAVRLAEERLNQVLESVADGFVGVDASWRITLMNGAARRHLRVEGEDPVGRDFWAVFTDVLGSPLEAALREAMAAREPRVFETQSIRRPGHFVELRMAPKAGGGLAIGFSDVTERLRAERHRELLVNELNHRVKNTLAIVQSMAYQTLRGAGVSQHLRTSFEGRLNALAAAHDILTLRKWESAYLHELVQTALKPFTPALAGRVSADGPDLRLSSRTAVSFALAMHELATNAVKYGALSGEGGQVSIVWRMARVADEPWLKFRWTERGAPRVAPPDTRGFGSRLIERAVSGDLGGVAQLRFEPEGVVCAIDAPMFRLEEIEAAPLDLQARR